MLLKKKSSCLEVKERLSNQSFLNVKILDNIYIIGNRGGIMKKIIKKYVR